MAGEADLQKILVITRLRQCIYVNKKGETIAKKIKTTKKVLRMLKEAIEKVLDRKKKKH